jgi:hypothetical protein
VIDVTGSWKHSGRIHACVGHMSRRKEFTRGHSQAPARDRRHARPALLKHALVPQPVQSGAHIGVLEVDARHVTWVTDAEPCNRRLFGDRAEVTRVASTSLDAVARCREPLERVFADRL